MLHINGTEIVSFLQWYQCFKNQLLTFRIEIYFVGQKALKCYSLINNDDDELKLAC